MPDETAPIDDDPVPQLAVDRLPSIDAPDVEPSYKDWSKADTMVVTYRVGNDLYPGKFAESREAALADCQLVHGRVLEANYVRGRAFFRVHKVKQ